MQATAHRLSPRNVFILLLLSWEVSSGLFDGNPYVTSMDDNSFPTRMTTNETWLVNFYSPWCPHCIHFAPKWKQMAIQCATMSEIHIGAVDCVANKKTCRDQEIKGFPTVKEFKAGSNGMTNAKNLKGVEMPRGDRLKDEMDRRCPKSASGVKKLDPSPAPVVGPVPPDRVELPVSVKLRRAGGEAPPSIASQPLEYADTLDHRLADATAAVVYTFEEVIFGARQVLSTEEGNRLQEFLTVLSRAFPFEKARKAFGELQHRMAVHGAITAAEFERIWREWKRGPGLGVVKSITPMYKGLVPSETKEANTDILLPIHIQPSKPGSSGSAVGPAYRTCGGYTCALWRLFHFVSLNCGLLPPFPTNQQCFDGIHSFVTGFFSCDVCREHFNKMYDRSFRSRFTSISGRDPELHHNEVALWIWHAHNRVNARLAVQKSASDKTSETVAAPKAGKVSAALEALWPSATSCGSCRSATADGSHIRRYDETGLSVMMEHSHTVFTSANDRVVTWREPVILVYLHQFYCHPEDDAGCARLMKEKEDHTFAALKTIVFLAKMFLCTVGLCAIGFALHQRHRLLLNVRWFVQAMGRNMSSKHKSPTMLLSRVEADR
mmetsp:Transcript_7274/g.17725  ORF Transcript_7274/g.17725 Transcript_7274/m.17725 type:complete len:606 (-) Transcript_7274:163-1980(-)